MSMSKCPSCGLENEAPAKAWKYSFFTVYAYTCKGCGTYYRDYYRDGRLSFTLRLVRGKGLVKA
jgi:uncharacterized Zn finger protein